MGKIFNWEKIYLNIPGLLWVRISWAMGIMGDKATVYGREF